MRNFILGIFVLLISVTSVSAQTGAEALKKAKKAFDNYSLKQDAAQLTEAIDMLQIAMDDASVKSDYKAQLEAGDIYAAAVQDYIIARSTGLTESPNPVKRAAVKSARSYMEAYKLSEKKSGKKAALKGLAALQGNITNEGIYAIQDTDYESSWEAFNASSTIHEFLNDNGSESSLTEDKINDDRYYAALSAILLERFSDAEPLLVKLYDAGYNDAGLYDGLYKVYIGKKDNDTAFKFLTEGREKFPDNTTLLFSEINFYIAEGRLEELITKLDEGIKKEPENASLYVVLAQTYEKLQTSALKEGDNEKGQMYYDKAKATYERGLEKLPNDATLDYSLGLLIYNRGASMSQELVELGNDFSKEGQRKYEALKAKVDAQFEKALPYFKKAEMSDPNDISTMIALKEMYARNENYELSNEFKSRIERVQAGEKIEKSYFKENGM